MFLSQLILNPRSREVRRDLADPYQMHRTLLAAFPPRENGGPGRILYRAEMSRVTGRMAVLLQSQQAPAWEQIRVAQDYFVEPPTSKAFDPVFRTGQRLQFRLRANPTVKREGKRLGLLREAEQLAWLQRKAENGGFRIESVEVIPEGMTIGHRKETASDLTHLAVRFDGVLHILDPDRFRITLEAGIGSAKGFGFGLLSLARPLE